MVRYPATEALGYEALERLVIAALPKGEPFMLLGESFSGPSQYRLQLRSHPA
ncbi:hypothetical protein [Pseudomonas sp. PA15(2017)]|uniref:hypothetical protein n=1 Tax=Pseudomonas sp. PA15(2017) TaxID=1932111 RepID=UPI0021145B71|nr:hypothetical protein [Pseudomonas sp. PA15(2017)]